MNQPVADQPPPATPPAATKPRKTGTKTAWKPIILACALTAGLMTLTIATYIGDAYTSKDTASQPTPTHTPATPLTKSDIEQADAYIADQIELLNQVTPPPASDLSKATLGL